MTAGCESVQGLIAEAAGSALTGDGAAGAVCAADADAAAHLAACRDCQAIAAAIVDLDGWLRRLPAIAPPDSLTATTLLAVARSALPPPITEFDAGASATVPSGWRDRLRVLLASPRPRPSRLLIAAALLAALVMVIPGVGQLWPWSAAKRPRSDFSGTATTAQETTAPDWKGDVAVAAPAADHDAVGNDSSIRRGVVDGASGRGNHAETEGKEAGSRAKKASSRGGQEQMAMRQAAINQSMNAAMYNVAPESVGSSPGTSRKDAGEKRDDKLAEVAEPLAPPVVAARREHADGSDTDSRFPSDAPPPRDDLARRLLTDPNDAGVVQFQEAAGYWSNSYVPGDATIRLLESRLAATGGFAIAAPDGRRRPLDAAARQYVQPFDQPGNSALAVYMHADRRGITAPASRLLLQVGLQATSRSSGLRTAMNVGVVLDLRGEIDRDVSAEMRALVTALNAAQETGDRFSLTVAGRPGGTLVPPAEFKFGAVAVALRQLFGDEPDPAIAPSLGLVDAVAAAMALVARADDPDAPLGASVVLLVTASTLADDIDALERMAGASAVSGIPMSVVACGDGTDADEIDRLTLAGQGNRRTLQSPADAAGIIDRELHSASRVVARAVRLRIRLAPGVKLVRVLRSERLDAAGSQQVRDAENSVDLRLARSLGIDADRGEDEEGLQIVIPSYYAGDSHVILLDVVAERPGSIADVTVRYKDLVYLRNGVARDNLSLGSSADGPGPLERNVLKNLVAIRLSDAIREAGGMLEAGEQQGAIATLDEQAQVIAGLRSTVAGWQNDVELLSDLQMIADYRALLAADLSSDDQRRQGLSDSLRYAGHMKVQARRR